jgi:hypothetical protein
MVMMNDLDRFHLVMDVIDRLPTLGSDAADQRQQMSDARLAARDLRMDAASTTLTDAGIGRPAACATPAESLDATRPTCQFPGGA